jgi:hypothetical protein
VLLSNTIIDDSGLIELFLVTKSFMKLEQKKGLPHSNLGDRYLKEYEYLNVELIDIGELVNQITISELCESLVIAQSTLYEKSNFKNG